MKRFRPGILVAVALAAANWCSPVRAVELRSARDSASVQIKDDRGAAVTLRVPLALHRGANHYRLWGARPLTLKSRDRRRDLYRDAFLELSTRAGLAPRASAWDDLRKQVEWLNGVKGAPTPPPAMLPSELQRAADEITKRASGLPGYPHLKALGESLKGLAPTIGVPDSLYTTLQLRALATDEAERRLTLLAGALPSGADPALHEGYRAACGEFKALREGFWQSIASGLRKNQGKFLVGALREAVLTPLGGWAVFGYLGWRGLESALNAEHRGQYAVCLAGLAAHTTEGATKDKSLEALAVYAEYALSYQLTEALRQDVVMALKPAGGRSAGSWQIELSGRLDELKKAMGEAGS
jgi:hypothetical protein